MSKAVKCPVCDGKGVVNGIADTGAMPTTECHGCFGKGWVEVGGSSYGKLEFSADPHNVFVYGDIHPMGYATTDGKVGYFS